MADQPVSVVRPVVGAQARSLPARLRGIAVGAGIYTLLLLLAASILGPLLWMILSGFKNNGELFGSAWSLPSTLRWSNYVDAWNLGVVQYLANSVIVTAASIVGVVVVSAWAAYALTRLRIPLNTPITLFILGGMMLAPAVALIPLFKLMEALGLYNTLFALIILYIAYRIPFTTFLIRAYMASMSREIEDAAYVDGASRWQIFWLIVFPLSRPILISAALLQALFAWNEFPFALVMINDSNLKTLPVGLLDMYSRLLTNFPVMFAGMTIAAVPMVVLFLIGQRQFIRGLAEGFGK
jgi:raffinose/stachyose/melibiose transport system permease protein